MEFETEIEMIDQLETSCELVAVMEIVGEGSIDEVDGGNSGDDTQFEGSIDGN